MLGVPNMQNLLNRFGKCVVKAGPLSGTTFEAVAPDRLRKAAKRYTGDPEFQKFAKSFVLLEYLKDENPEPAPCVPIPLNKEIALLTPPLWKRCLRKLAGGLAMFWSNRVCRWLVIFFFIGFFARQSFCRAIGKLFVTSFRLTVRRLVSFFIMMVEGLFDEIVYQLDYVLRDALPAGMSIPEATVASFNWLSHTVSGALGALFATMLQTRRLQPA